MGGEECWEGYGAGSGDGPVEQTSRALRISRHGRTAQYRLGSPDAGCGA